MRQTQVHFSRHNRLPAVHDIQLFFETSVALHNLFFILILTLTLNF